MSWVAPLNILYIRQFYRISTNGSKLGERSVNSRNMFRRIDPRKRKVDRNRGNFPCRRAFKSRDSNRNLQLLGFGPCLLPWIKKREIKKKRDFHRVPSLRIHLPYITYIHTLTHTHKYVLVLTPFIVPKGFNVGALGQIFIWFVDSREETLRTAVLTKDWTNLHLCQTPAFYFKDLTDDRTSLLWDKKILSLILNQKFAKYFNFSFYLR